MEKRVETLPTRSRWFWVRGYDELQMYWRAYVLFGLLSFMGMVLGWDTGLIGGILRTASFKRSFGLEPNVNQSSHYISQKQGNIVSVLNAGCMAGGFGGFYFPARFGHRKVIAVGSLLLQTGAIIQTFCHPHDFGITPATITAESQDRGVRQLMVGRFISGMGIGLCASALVPYHNEVAPSAIRGRLHVLGALNAVIGIALSFWVNYGVQRDGYDAHDTRVWRIPFGLQTLPGAVFMLAIVFIPNSPRWLIEKRGDEKAARRSLAKVYNGDPHDPRINETIAEIHASIRHMNHDFGKMARDVSTSSHGTLTNVSPRASHRVKWRLVFKDRKTVFRLFLGGFMMMIQQWTGTNALNYYSPQIFSSLGLGNVELLATGVYGIVKVCGAIFLLLVGIEGLGRKWCNIIGSVGQVTAMYWIGIYLRIHPSVEGKSTTISAAGWMTVIMVYLFAFFFGIGWASVASAFSSELAPCNAELRSVSWAFATIIQWLFTTVISKIVPLMLQDLKYGTFLFFGTMTALGCLFVVFCLPETQGVPLERIDALFEGSTRDIVRRSLLTISPSGRRRVHAELATGAL